MDAMGQLTPRQAARFAGYGYLALFGLAMFANFFVLSGLVEQGDAAATAANIAESPGLFRLGLASFLIVFILDVAIAWALYVFFRREHRDLSLVTAWFRLVYTTLLGVAAIALFVVLELLSGDRYLAAFDPSQLDVQAMVFLEAFNYAWLIGLACFGVHLLLLGYLAIRSEAVPSAIGFLLMLAGIGYLIDTFAHALLSNYDEYETLFLVIVALPSIVGEAAFAIWLLMRGGRSSPASTITAPDASMAGSGLRS